MYRDHGRGMSGTTQFLEFLTGCQNGTSDSNAYVVFARVNHTKIASTARGHPGEETHRHKVIVPRGNLLTDIFFGV